MSDVSGVVVSDLIGVSKPLEKLIEVVSAGIGKLYEPTHIRRMAQAKAEEIGIIGDAISDNLSLPTAYTNGNVSIESPELNALAERTVKRFAYQEVRKQQNIESVVEKAYGELKNEKEVSSQAVDSDWISHFFDSLGNVSSEEMQQLWARILAGEVKEPGSCSIRTLTILKTFSLRDAKNFEKLSRYCFTTGLFSLEYLTDNDVLPYSELADFQAMGLLSYGLGLTYVLSPTPEQAFTLILNNGRRLFLITDVNERKELQNNIGILTASGREILKIVSEQALPEKEYFYFWKSAASLSPTAKMYIVNGVKQNGAYVFPKANMSPV